MNNIIKKFYFSFFIFFLFFSFFSNSAFSATEQKLSITDGNIFQKIINFFSGLLNNIINFWKKNIGEPASRVWDKIRFFFLNGVINKTPEIKKELVKEVGEMKQDIPLQSETFFQKVLHFFKR
jgi:hypothetical protein